MHRLRLPSWYNTLLFLTLEGSSYTLLTILQCAAYLGLNSQDATMQDSKIATFYSRQS